MSTKKGFTLLELLIVIAILAILATATVLVLNPAELLKQSRDAQRITDLDSLKSALSLYLATAATTSLANSGTCGTSWWNHLSATSVTSSPFTATTGVSSTNRAVTGGGWIPVTLSNATGGSPIPTMPVDPTNTTDYFYSYSCDSTNLTFELDANLESSKFASKELQAGDGGNRDGIYEIGTDPTLDL